MAIRNFYAGAVLDRAAHRRDDEAWLREALSQRRTRLVPIWRDKSLFAAEDDLRPTTIAGLTFGAADAPLVWLGSMDGHDYFAVDLSELDDPLAHPALPDDGRFEDLRRVGPNLPHEEGALLAYARAITYWHRRHRHCAACGAPTRSVSAGHGRVCTSDLCGIQHFPRTDPAIIVLVHDGGDRIILGRSPRFPQTGMQSVLAGFVEPGESLEDTVRREVKEEVDIDVTDIRYHSSQPFPFPSSLMIGFTARATSFDIRPDPSELETADWYAREFLVNSPEDDSFRLPRGDSIARRLVNDWL